MNCSFGPSSIKRGLRSMPALEIWIFLIEHLVQHLVMPEPCQDRALCSLINCQVAFAVETNPFFRQ
jgi:hypothetical protein